MIESEWIPCKTCGDPTTFPGTKLCNGCWEVQTRLQSYLNNKNAIQFVSEALNKAKDTPPDPQHGREQEWICPRCRTRNAANNEVCMGAEMGDGRCGKSKPDKVKPECETCKGSKMFPKRPASKTNLTPEEPCPDCQQPEELSPEEENQINTKPCPYNNAISCVQYPENGCGCDCDPCKECEVKLNIVKPLAQYLDEYLRHEVVDVDLELLEQALDAYQSTENVTIKIERR